MGNSYQNITLRGPSREAVIAALERHRRTAYVSPTDAQDIVVFDREAEDKGDPRELGDLALTLSQELQGVALAVAVYDDDLLLLSLYERGTQRGEYNSSEGSSLTASALARAFDVRARAALVAVLLGVPHFPVFLFEGMRHGALIKLLKTSPWADRTGYKYLRNGEPPPGLDPSRLHHVEAP
jgi:hypothetical protein